MGATIWKLLPLRKKVLIYFSVVIVIIGAISTILYYNMTKAFQQFDSVYTNLKTLESYSASIEKISSDLNTFLSQGDRTYISSFYQEYNNVLEEMGNSPLVFTKKEDNILFVNIRHMVETYGEEADTAINEYRKRDLGESSSRFSRTIKIQAYIQEGIKELILSFTSQSKIFQKNLLDQLLVLRTLIIILIIMSVALYILLATYFSRALVKPIDALVGMADKISHGNFNVEQVTVSSHSELKMLSDTLYRMSSEISKYIAEIKEKAKVEKLLKEKELENLKINALLQETEYKRLQAQVNPHFLFNTLTTLHHTAFLEDANETCEIAEAISKILRYNLRKSNTVVQLRDEIENIRYYVYIQEKRYKHRVKVEFDIDEQLLDLMIPNMTVQPIVENSFIHGIENNENGGRIVLKVYRLEEFTVVEVKDSGVGIDEKKLEHIRNMVCDESDYSGHTSSIGIINVVKRLQAFYDSKDLFRIDSTPNEGTTIKLLLPTGFNYMGKTGEEDFVDL